MSGLKLGYEKSRNVPEVNLWDPRLAKDVEEFENEQTLGEMEHKSVPELMVRCLDTKPPEVEVWQPDLMKKDIEDGKEVQTIDEEKAVPVPGLTIGYKEMRRNVPRVNLWHPDLLKDSEFVKATQARGEQAKIPSHSTYSA